VPRSRLLEQGPDVSQCELNRRKTRLPPICNGLGQACPIRPPRRSPPPPPLVGFRRRLGPIADVVGRCGLSPSVGRYSLSPDIDLAKPCRRFKLELQPPFALGTASDPGHQPLPTDQNRPCCCESRPRTHRVTKPASSEDVRCRADRFDAELWPLISRRQRLLARAATSLLDAGPLPALGTASRSGPCSGQQAKGCAGKRAASKRRPAQTSLSRELISPPDRSERMPAGLTAGGGPRQAPRTAHSVPPRPFRTAWPVGGKGGVLARQLEGRQPPNERLLLAGLGSPGPLQAACPRAARQLLPCCSPGAGSPGLPQPWPTRSTARFRWNRRLRRKQSRNRPALRALERLSAGTIPRCCVRLRPWACSRSGSGRRWPGR